MTAGATALPRVVLAASFLAMALIAEASALGPAAPGVAGRLGVSLATAGMLVPVHNAGALVGILWWGRSQGRVPAARLLSVGTGILLVGAVLVATNPGAAGRPLAPSPLLGAEVSRPAFFAVLAGAALLLGIGFGLLDAGVNTVLAQRGVGAGLLNALHGTFGLTAIGLPLLVGFADARAAYALVALGCLGLFAPLRHTPRLRRPRRDGGAAAGRSRPWVVMLTVAMGVEIGAAAWAATHLVGLGRGEAEASAAVAGFFATFTAVRFVLAPFADRTDPGRIVRGGLLVAALAAVLALLGPWPTAAWALVGVGIGPVFPTTLSWLVGSHEDDRAATRLMVGGSVGGIVLPALVGLVVAVVGPETIPLTIGVIALVAWLLARRLPGLPPTVR